MLWGSITKLTVDCCNIWQTQRKYLGIELTGFQVHRGCISQLSGKKVLQRRQAIIGVTTETIKRHMQQHTFYNDMLVWCTMHDLLTVCSQVCIKGQEVVLIICQHTQKGSSHISWMWRERVWGHQVQPCSLPRLQALLFQPPLLQHFDSVHWSHPMNHAISLTIDITSSLQNPLFDFVTPKSLEHKTINSTDFSMCYRHYWEN